MQRRAQGIWQLLRDITGVLISPQSDQEGNKLQRQTILMFIYPIYYHNWRNFNTIYIYNETSIKRNILTIKQNTGVLISPQRDQEGNKLQRQTILMFIYPIYYHNWRNFSTIYVMYITRQASNEIFSPSNKIHREVGQAKDLSAPRYFISQPQAAVMFHI